MSGKYQAIKISFIYLLFGILWIASSDKLLGLFSPTREMITTISIIKGWIFVGLSSALIYSLSNRYIGKLSAANCKLQKSYDELSATHEKLTRSQARKLALFNAMPDLLLLVNKEGIFLDYKATEDFAMFVPPEKFLGKNISNIFPAEIAQKALYHLRQTINGGKNQLFEYQLSMEEQVRHFESRFIKSGDDEALAIIRDITDSKQMAQQLEFLSLHDALTGLYNRTFFEEEIMRLQGKNRSVGIVVCDVDGLKMINDTLGHRAGDELLKVAANILKAACPRDIIARVGGDEFAVILDDPEQHNPTRIVNFIQTEVDTYNAQNPQLPLSLSLGWAADPGEGGSADALFKEADNNMCREKMHNSFSTRSAIVEALMHALEARDYITEGHAERLHSLVEVLARKLQLSAKTTADLRLFAKFHDIGKVGIPDSILFKPGQLTLDEKAVMRRHCEIGFRIAKSAPDLTPIAEWILKHQEWWNGKGYPLGLAGEEIPLECRILALADAYDAMTSDRPYRKAMSHPEAIGELRRCAGIQFDPSLTEMFIESLEESKSIRWEGLR